MKKFLAFAVAACMLFTLPLTALAAPAADTTVYLKGAGTEFSAAGWSNVFKLGGAENAADPSVWRLVYTGKDINQVKSVHIAFTNGQAFNWDPGMGFSTNGGGKNQSWIIETPYDWAIAYVNSGNNNASGSFLVTGETGNGLNFNIGGFHQGTPDNTNTGGGTSTGGDTTNTGDNTNPGGDTTNTGDNTNPGGDNTNTGDNTNPGVTTNTGDNTNPGGDTTNTGDNTNPGGDTANTGEVLTPSQPTQGDGTSADPYIIDTAGELAWLADAESSYAKLDTDIDLTGVDWTPIGTADAPFKGSFDGGGHTITGLTIDTTDDYAGLLGYVSGGTIQNLVLDNVNISGADYVGGVAGYVVSGGSLTGCTVSGAVSGSGDNVGGVAGYVEDGKDVITDCHSSAAVSGNGDNVGGVAGCVSVPGVTLPDLPDQPESPKPADPAYPSDYPDTVEPASAATTDSATSGFAPIAPSSASLAIPMSSSAMISGDITLIVPGDPGDTGGTTGGDTAYFSSISNCSTSGDVSGNRCVGGVVGSSYGVGGMTDCCATGSVTGTNLVGGVVGILYGTVTNCYATGNVTGVNWIGGLAGSISEGLYTENFGVGEMTYCHATGNVSGNMDVGGLLGENFSTVKYCYATGDVTGYDECIGGLVGDSYGPLESCYATGKVTGKVDSSHFAQFVGGVAGSSCFSGSITNCYATGAVSGDYSIGGVVGSTLECKISYCYATGAISCRSYSGGVVGESDNDTITNCVALNRSVSSGLSNLSSYLRAGRVVGCIALYYDIYGNPNPQSQLSNNLAYSGMGIATQTTSYSIIANASGIHGASITPAAIVGDGTLGGCFTAPAWITQNGKLPILAGDNMGVQAGAIPTYITAALPLT